MPKKRGRPSKYKESYCEDILDFFDYPLFTIHQESGKLIPNEPKFMTDFSQSIGVCKDTLNEWCKVHKDFSVAYKNAKNKMIDKIVKGGLLNIYNSGVTCFTLKNIAGWRDNKPDEFLDDKLEDELEFKGMPKSKINGRFSRFYN